MQTEIETRVCGIPAIARVTHYHRQRPMGPSADSDWDCYGYLEIEFDVLDQRGRPAPWLQRKLTLGEIHRIENEITQHIEGDDE